MRATGALFHETRHYPRRADEILDGGSIYWVVKGFVRVRQRIVRLERRASEERGRFCRIHLDPVLVRTELQPRRPHQGWRYLQDIDAPPDRAGRCGPRGAAGGNGRGIANSGAVVGAVAGLARRPAKHAT